MLDLQQPFALLGSPHYLRQPRAAVAIDFAHLRARFKAVIFRPVPHWFITITASFITLVTAIPPPIARAAVAIDFARFKAVIMFISAVSFSPVPHWFITITARFITLVMWVTANPPTIAASFIIIERPTTGLLKAVIANSEADFIIEFIRVHPYFIEATFGSKKLTANSL